jgi:hypothetical protein
VEELSDERCVLADPDRYRLSRLFVRVCREAGVQPDISYTTDMAAAAAVVCGTTAVTPTYLQHATVPGLLHRRLHDPALGARILLAWDRDSAFAGHARTVIDAVLRERVRAGG